MLFLKSNKHLSLGLNKGFTLIEIIVASTILSALVIGVIKLMRSSSAAIRSLDNYHQLDVIKKIVLNELDCQKTLNININTLYPLTCPKALVLKNKFNDNIFPTNNILGEWQLTASCFDSKTNPDPALNTKFGIFLNRKLTKADPLRGAAPDLMQDKDLFDGIYNELTGGFCSQYLKPSLSSCENNPELNNHSIYNLQVGFDPKNGAKCCRVVTASSSRFLEEDLDGCSALKNKGRCKNIAEAKCQKNEYLYSGLGYCTPEQGAIKTVWRSKQSIALDMGLVIGIGNKTTPKQTTDMLPGALATHIFSGNFPTVGHFFFTDIWEPGQEQHGGFLAASLPDQDVDNNLNIWRAKCFWDDWSSLYTSSWNGNYIAKAEVICCPK